jgi:hypothetical protein
MLRKLKVFLLRGQISVGWPDALRKTGQFYALELTFRQIFIEVNMKNIAVFLLIISCAHHTSQKTVKGPDGSKHKLVSCGAIEACYNRSAELCGTYKIVNTSHDTYTDGNGKTHTSVNLLVKCDERVSVK